MQAGGARASHNACLHTIARLCFYYAFLLYNLNFILLWNIFNAICFMCFIFVNSVIVSSNISCNDLYQDFILMFVWYFLSRNSMSVCDMAFIEPMHRNKPNITYLLTCWIFRWINMNIYQNGASLPDIQVLATQKAMASAVKLLTLLSPKVPVVVPAI